MDGLAFLEQHRPQLEALFRQYGVERAYAFGSVVKGDFRDDSDVDLLVKFEPAFAYEHYLDLYLDVEKLFRRRIDLVDMKKVSNPYFKMELKNTARRIYG